uniref:Uncharacterized protein n=1 Tax=Rhizophora mucronata TaxID=61149 RepID=A0A2P2IH36_RHIMU
MQENISSQKQEADYQRNLSNTDENQNMLTLSCRKHSIVIYISHIDQNES